MKSELFFIGTGLGMESELALELQELFPYFLDINSRPHCLAWEIKSLQKGGVLIEAPLVLALQINFFSKLASRVLWQVGFFKSIHLNDFLRKMDRLELKKKLGDLGFSFKVSCEKSKLYHEAMIVRELEKLFESPKTEKPSQQIFIRIRNDEVVVSLDSTGEHLHKRGYRELTPTAPLRETLASFGLRKLFGESTIQKVTQTTIVDPFCGSGTLLIEAARWNHPFWFRDYSFFNWTCAPALLKSPKVKSNYRNLKVAFKENLFGSDVNPEVIALAERNSKKAEVKIDFKVSDLEKLKTEGKAPIWIVTNPPYDERLSTTLKPKGILELLKKLSPEKILIFGPESWSADFQKDLSFKEEWPLKNGGLSIRAYLFN